jgi:hypothetical protein
MIGMGMQVAISCAANALLSFLVFWLVFDTPMKEYYTHDYNATSGEGHMYYKAPIFLAATVLGMVALVYAEKIAIKLGSSMLKLPSGGSRRVGRVCGGVVGVFVSVVLLVLVLVLVSGVWRWWCWFWLNVVRCIVASKWR